MVMTPRVFAELERVIAGLDAKSQSALLLSSDHSFEDAASKLDIPEAELAEHLRQAKSAVREAWLGANWQDHESEFVVDIYIDAIATRMQRRRQSVAFRIRQWFTAFAVEWRGSPVTLVTRLALAAAGSLAVYYGAGDVAGRLTEWQSEWQSVADVAGESTARLDGERLLGAEPAIAAQAEALGYYGGPAEQESEAEFEWASGSGGLGGRGRRREAAWSEVEAGWLQISALDGADISGAEGGHARIVTLWREMEDLWRVRSEGNRQPSAIFVRELDDVLRAGTGTGIAASCAPWQFAGASIAAREEERRQLETRRKELEVVRRGLEIEKREWEIERREKEVRRRELEAMRRRAEADRAALEAAGSADSEEYWRGMREYERVLFGDYARVLGGELETFEIEYNDFMTNTYVAGQREYANEVAVLLVRYGALGWGCDVLRGFSGRGGEKVF